MNYTDTSASQNALYASVVAAAFPPGVPPVSCAVPILLPAIQYGFYRDGFIGFRAPVAPLLASALLNPLANGSLIPLQQSDLSGALMAAVSTLQTAGVPFSFSAVVPPAALTPPQLNDTTASCAYAFGVMGAACCLWPMPSSPYRQLAARQSVPVQAFGFQVITTRPVYPPPDKIDQLFFWTQPFTASLWLLVVGASVACACIPRLLAPTQSVANARNPPACPWRSRRADVVL